MIGKIRRSIKSEKDTRPHHLSIPAKDPLAIVPPKKVIKALYDYQTNDPSQVGYLSFQQGDFLHVIAREDDPDWYEACNPIKGTRGLVPVKYFEGVGKNQVRDSASSTNSAPSQPSAGHDSHDSGYAEARSPGNTTAGASEKNGPQPMRLSKALARGTGAMLYGEVIYDFKAERPDELEAKAGEFIIVIAQSNPEWFVVKPITRLGGPGLIPVSFIQLKDMHGNIEGDPLDAVARAGIPKVEEWKKMAADYKNGSIPLGRLESNSAQSLQQGMERMSVGGKSQSNGSIGGARAPSSYSQHTQRGPRANLAPIRAAVPDYGFNNEDESFFFFVRCQMEDGRHMLLERTYQNFYDLQINLIQEFPAEAGNVNGVERSLPYMPGPVTYVTENITYGRRPNLDEYIRNLLKLSPQITRGHLVCDFFTPRGNDRQDPEATEDDYRLSNHSDLAPDSRKSSNSNLYKEQPYSTSNDYAYQANHQRQQSSIASQKQHYRNQSDLQVPPPMLRQNSALTQASANSAGSGMTSRIKVLLGGTTDVGIIKMAHPPSLAVLQDWACTRWKGDFGQVDPEDLVFDYDDSTYGKTPITSDQQLQYALETYPNAKLSVTSPRSANY